MIGEPSYVPQFSGSKCRLVEKRDAYQYIPFLSSLKALLLDSTIIEEIQKCPERYHKDGKMEDFCDGNRFKQHTLFKNNPHAIQILAHFDEVEMCNPLGSHIKKHKMGIVTYTIGNVHPKYRSKLKCMQLAVITSVPVIERYGIHEILKPFVDDLNILATNGIKVSTGGSTKIYKGALLAFLADNLASNDLGGFKKSFSFSFRFCRTCLVTQDTMHTGYVSEAYDMRNEIEHLTYLQMLEGAASSHYSKTYGINEKSSLLNIKHFSLFDGGLPHDIMHDIFEGIAPLEIKKLLLYHISANSFTLSEFNERLINFDYGYTESDKPVPILSSTLKSNKTLRSSASEMIVLVHILPFLIADKILENDDHWACFLLLRKITDIVLSPVVTENDCSSLKLAIKEHHSTFMDYEI